MQAYDDPQLISYATQRDLDYIEALKKHGTPRKAAKHVGVSHQRIQKAMQSLRARAALKGYAPEHDMRRTVPDPYIVKGVSTYYDRDGKAAGQWVKSTLDQSQREAAMRAAVEALADEVPRVQPTATPAYCEQALCNVYTLTDSHVGMRAWGKETGADWDLIIAERVLIGAFEHMVLASPKAATCVVAQLGDFLHSDGIVGVTPTSGHVLDMDSRFSKVVATAVRVLRHVVSLALNRHERVIVLMAEGNHDVTSSIWLRHLFGLLYENEPRVSVIDSELPYYVHQHGHTMLAWHHGHLKKPDGLPGLLAAQFPVVWGNTTKRYCHTGHQHHTYEREHPGITVIQHPTLAARDAYAARGGWYAERQVTAITYHDRWGQVARATVCPEMLA